MKFQSSLEFRGISGKAESSTSLSPPIYESLTLSWPASMVVLESGCPWRARLAERLIFVEFQATV